MLRIDPQPWARILAHACGSYPEECCGALIGRLDGNLRHVLAAVPLENAFAGSRRTRYEIRPQDLYRAEKEARELDLSLFGIYHSHPDCDAYFSQTDLRYACPWYCFLVLSIRSGRFVRAGCWLPDPDLTSAEQLPVYLPDQEE